MPSFHGSQAIRFSALPLVLVVVIVILLTVVGKSFLPPEALKRYGASSLSVTSKISCRQKPSDNKHAVCFFTQGERDLGVVDQLLFLLSRNWVEVRCGRAPLARMLVSSRPDVCNTSLSVFLKWASQLCLRLSGEMHGRCNFPVESHQFVCSSQDTPRCTYKLCVLRAARTSVHCQFQVPAGNAG